MQVYGGTDIRDRDLGGVGVPLHHKSALQQSTGEAVFIDDIPKSAGLLMSSFSFIKCDFKNFSASALYWT